MPWDLIETVSGLLIAVAGLFVVMHAIYGRWLEYLATRPDNKKREKTLEASARVHYLQASLSKWPILMMLVIGIILQILVGFRKLFC